MLGFKPLKPLTIDVRVADLKRTAHKRSDLRLPTYYLISKLKK